MQMASSNEPERTVTFSDVSSVIPTDNGDASGGGTPATPGVWQQVRQYFRRSPKTPPTAVSDNNNATATKRGAIVTREGAGDVPFCCCCCCRNGRCPDPITIGAAQLESRSGPIGPSNGPDLNGSQNIGNSHGVNEGAQLEDQKSEDPETVGNEGGTTAPTESDPAETNAVEEAIEHQSVDVQDFPHTREEANVIEPSQLENGTAVERSLEMDASIDHDQENGTDVEGGVNAEQVIETRSTPTTYRNFPRYSISEGSAPKEESTDADTVRAQASSTTPYTDLTRDPVPEEATPVVNDKSRDINWLGRRRSTSSSSSSCSSCTSSSSSIAKSTSSSNVITKQIKKYYKAATKPHSSHSAHPTALSAALPVKPRRSQVQSVEPIRPTNATKSHHHHHHHNVRAKL